MLPFSLQSNRGVLAKCCWHLYPCTSTVVPDRMNRAPSCAMAARALTLVSAK